MSTRHLTAVYRPQTFAHVVGQQSVSTILSRAAAQQRIAPAYMFSGTRGVGKTTVARIFAKAINCSSGPAAEPCNECSHCREITRGSSLDVLEIDGASHTGVDHVRKLNEDVGYAPIECRYKVIIIDEAHMLSRSAFNALLKTLEEPPRHATFILATTEPHKFPATIVSRCQHYNFKRIAQAELERFLQAIVDQEEVDCEAAALRLLARKGAGSVRDSLSLLSQILALGEARIDAETVKDILGVAGHEVMRSLIDAFAAADSRRIVELGRELLESGLDLGHFLQELATVWRNLFLLKKLGSEAEPLMEASREEIEDWKELSGSLPLEQIHAAWQMTLEGQRRVLQSVDPGLALELLLLNIAHLPELVFVHSQPQPQRTGSSSTGTTAGGGQSRPARTEVGSADDAGTGGASSGPGRSSARDWDGFVAFAKDRGNGQQLPSLWHVRGRIEGDSLVIRCPSFWYTRMQEKGGQAILERLAREYFERAMEVRLEVDQGNGGQNIPELKKKVLSDPNVQEVMERFKAKVVEVRPKDVHGTDASGQPKT
jgi:DNA polymerase-3 subunit gamma/tau